MGMNVVSEEQYLELYDTHRDKVLYYIRRRITNHHDAEDLTEEIFQYLYRRLPQFDNNKSPLVAYLYLITKSRLKNYYRDKKIYVSFNEAFIIHDEEDQNNYIDKALELMHSREIVHRLLLRLGEREREFIVLRFFNNNSPQEIADIKGVSTGNVRVILSRAITKMRQLLQDIEEEVM